MPIVMSSSVLAIISLFMPGLVSQYEGVMLPKFSSCITLLATIMSVPLPIP